jgi:hypothetical protein
LTIDETTVKEEIGVDVMDTKESVHVNFEREKTTINLPFV